MSHASDCLHRIERFLAASLAETGRDFSIDSHEAQVNVPGALVKIAEESVAPSSPGIAFFLSATAAVKDLSKRSDDLPVNGRIQHREDHRLEPVAVRTVVK